MIPVRRIFSENDFKRFREESAVCQKLMAFIEELAATCQGCLSTDSLSLSSCEQEILDLIADLEKGTLQFPPLQQTGRFGNRAFVSWLGWLCNFLDERKFTFLGIQELTYLKASFGDSSRIDYGTGHELHFLVFLHALKTNGNLVVSSATVLGLFWRYWRLVHTLIVTYHLEPAGSHGVWGLDDFQHLPFLFGAAQLVDSSISVEDVFKGGHERTLFGWTLEFVKKSKGKIPLQECAPVLWGVSSVSSWSKVTLGLAKMYDTEVLGKKVVVQHLLFGQNLS